MQTRHIYLTLSPTKRKDGDEAEKAKDKTNVVFDAKDGVSSEKQRLSDEAMNTSSNRNSWVSYNRNTFHPQSHLLLPVRTWMTILLPIGLDLSIKIHPNKEPS